MTGDYMVRAVAFGGAVRAFSLRTTELADYARQKHSLYPIASAALGRTMTAALVLGSMQKNGSVTVQVRGNGPLRTIVVSADHDGRVRGYVGNPFVQLPLNNNGKLPVGDAVGSGTLNVIRDLGMKEPYRGIVPLESGEIGDDFARYFYDSEQTPSVVSVGVLVNPDTSVAASGGLILQLLPGAASDVVGELEQRIPTLLPVSSLIANGKKPEEILHMTLNDFGLRILDKQLVSFSCDCSKERFSEGLQTLGRDELEQILSEDGEAELICHFCEETYHFDSAELQAILDDLLRDGLEEKT